MSTEANKAVVRRFFDEAWNEGGVERLDEYVAADNAHHFGAVTGQLGPSELREIIAAWKVAFPDYRANLEEMVAEGDMVAVSLTFTGTHQGTFQLGPHTLEPTGDELRERELFMFKIVDGKIVESRAAWDRLSVLGQLGGSP
jgi:predicted ester cyclase